MVTALVLGMLPAAIGVGVLLLPARSAHLGPARALAVGAALAVVGAELLPGGVDALGLVALLVAAVGLVLPRLVDHALARAQARAGASGFELGFAALMVHQLSDGLQMGAARPLGAGVILAIAAHGVPLVAAATLAAARVRGGGRAALRGAALVGATGVGILASGLVDEATLTAVAPVVGVVLAGFLVHAVTHGLEDDPPIGAGARAVEAVAFALGVAGTVALLHGVHASAGHAPHGHAGFGAATLDLLGVTGVAVGASTALGRALGRRAHVAGVDVVLGALLLGPWVGAAQAAAAWVAGPDEASRERATSPWLLLGVVLAACIVAFVHPADVPRWASAVLLGLASLGVGQGLPLTVVVLVAAALAPAFAPTPAAALVVVVAATVRAGRSSPVAGAVGATAGGLAVLIDLFVDGRLAPAAVPGLVPVGVALFAALVGRALLVDGPRAWLATLLASGHAHAAPSR